MASSAGATDPPLNFKLAFTDRTGEPVPDVLVYSTNKDTKLQKPVNQIIDQRNKKFTPFVTSLSPGGSISFPNSDDTRHHVYSFSPTKTFQLKLYKSNDAPPVQFDKPGIVSLGCNIHDNMEAYIVVTDHRVYGVSDNLGQLAIERQANKFSGQLNIWHPLLKNVTLITLPSSEPSPETVTILLDIEWQPHQEAKTRSHLESLLKQFKSKSN